ncbi:hypothetical protein [Halobacterium sp. CBA1126]|uniref:hypothetical protein n=1 Tax=Halobacterium sp. CBA1126 TaxID=2668074 RepID=UPI0012F98858|nr:hypothetical protein [Halobacterium sp. CBA1126]MUV61619.1 hypothetical protein [Halobacterium sp. CBA1126]
MTLGPDGEQANVAALRSACDESRAVLDDQLGELSDIGDKALWTVRTSMIVLGVVASAASLGDARTLRQLHPGVGLLGVAGVALLVAASVYGLGTYFGADRIRGISPEYRRQARESGLSERDWRQALLRGYDEWIAEMEATTDRYGTHLFRAQALFLLGVVAFVLTAGLSLGTL